MAMRLGVSTDIITLKSEPHYTSWESFLAEHFLSGPKSQTNPPPQVQLQHERHRLWRKTFGSFHHRQSPRSGDPGPDQFSKRNPSVFTRGAGTIPRYRSQAGHVLRATKSSKSPRTGQEFCSQAQCLFFQQATGFLIHRWLSASNDWLGTIFTMRWTRGSRSILIGRAGNIRI